MSIRIKQLKIKVEKILKEYPETRNSDITLTVKIWEEYYPKALKKREADGKTYVAVESLYKLPREDNVKRLRAKIQNEENRFLPTSAKVAKQRHMNMDMWHKAMAFNHYAND